MTGRADRVGRIAWLAVLALAPLAYWPAWDDCFPLAKWLVLALGASIVLVTGGRPHPAFRWLGPWTVWVAVAALAGPGVRSAWRAWPEAALLVLPPAAAACAGAPAGAVAAVIRLASGLAALGAVREAWTAGAAGWLSPFAKGVASTAGNPDLLGGLLLPAFGLAAARWAAAPGRAARILEALLLGLGLALTESRAAWLGALVAAAAVAWAARRRAVSVGVAAVLGAAALGLAASPGAYARLRSGGAAAERLWTWRLGMEALRTHPVAGWGPSSYRGVHLEFQAAGLAAGTGFFHYTEYAHLEPLHLAVELGLGGLGLWLWGLAAAVAGWRTGALRRRDPVLWAGIGAGGAAVLVDALLSWPFHVPPTVLPWWALAAAAAGPARSAPARGPRVAVAGGLALVALAAACRPAYVSGALRLGQAFAVHGRFAEAGGVYGRAARLGDGDVRLCWYAGSAARHAGEPAAALVRLDRGRALEPGFAEVELERAECLRALARPVEAEAAWRRALALNPGNADGWNNLGNFLGAAGRLAEAEAAQRRAVALDPASRAARQNLFVTLVRRGRRAEARRVLMAAP